LARDGPARDGRLAPAVIVGHAGLAVAGLLAWAAYLIAAEEFERPIKWVEDDSRDTHENAARTIALLKPAGIDHIILVTHGYHMPRAMRAFTDAAGSDIKIEAAPMGLAKKLETPALEWMPSSRGFTRMRQVMREIVGKAAGA